MLLKGVIDCPDLGSLNVSMRLQNDGFVKKISEYIGVEKGLTSRQACARQIRTMKILDDISLFIKFGCLKDTKFSERMMDYILYKNIDGKHLTLKDCIKANENQKRPKRRRKLWKLRNKERLQRTARKTRKRKSLRRQILQASIFLYRCNPSFSENFVSFKQLNLMNEMSYHPNIFIVFHSFWHMPDSLSATFC